MILLFWFLIVSLALAWGIAGYQQDEAARRTPPPAPKSAPAATLPPALIAPTEPANTPDGDQNVAPSSGAVILGAPETTAPRDDLPNADETK